jgi:hypothetical protein
LKLFNPFHAMASIGADDGFAQITAEACIESLNLAQRVVYDTLRGHMQGMPADEAMDVRAPARRMLATLEQLLP